MSQEKYPAKGRKFQHLPGKKYAQTCAAFTGLVSAFSKVIRLSLHPQFLYCIVFWQVFYNEQEIPSFVQYFNANILPINP